MNTAMPNAETALTDAVAAAFAQTPDPRLRHLMESLVRHLHAFVAEVEPTEAEWMAAIRFLTETGQICDGAVRQEFILLSDTLGVSMLVDAINHRKPGQATESTVFGPFYMAGMPDRAPGENMALTPGEPALVHGYVRDTDGRPLAGAVLDVWQTASNGMYSGQDVDQPHGNLRGPLPQRRGRLLRNPHHPARVLSHTGRRSRRPHDGGNRQAYLPARASALHDRRAGAP